MAFVKDPTAAVVKFDLGNFWLLVHYFTTRIQLANIINIIKGNWLCLRVQQEQPGSILTTRLWLVHITNRIQQAPFKTLKAEHYESVVEPENITGKWSLSM